MLIGIPPHLPAELLHVLACMGHGDTIVLVDANYPAHSNARHTHLGHAIEMPGRDLVEATADILALMPLDSFADDSVGVMASPADETPSVHQAIADHLKSVTGAPQAMTQIDRFDFYVQSREAFAIVRTMERRPYGNVILKMGVLAPDGSLMTPTSAIAVK